MNNILSVLIEISIIVGITGIAFWIWKNRNFSIFKKVALIITFAISLIIAFYALFTFVIVSSDQANYSA